MARKRSADLEVSSDADTDQAGAVYRSGLTRSDPKLMMVAAALGMTAPNYVNSRLLKVINTELTAAIEEVGLSPKPNR